MDESKVGTIDIVRSPRLTDFTLSIPFGMSHLLETGILRKGTSSHGSTATLATICALQRTNESINIAAFPDASSGCAKCETVVKITQEPSVEFP